MFLHACSCCHALQHLIQDFKPHLHRSVVNMTYMLPVCKGDLVTKDNIFGEMPEVCNVGSPDPNEYKTIFNLWDIGLSSDDVFSVFEQFEDEILQVLVTSMKLSGLSSPNMQSFGVGRAKQTENIISQEKSWNKNCRAC